MGGLAKIDVSRFKPSDLRDQPQPLLQWVEMDLLVIDRTYQREITAAGARAIQKMADGFDWAKFEPILCAPTVDGRLAVVDGQHRAHAVAVLGLPKIPAMVVPMTPAQQAAGFTAINRDRIRVSTTAIFRAELAAGVEWAIAADRAVRAAGCSLATYSPRGDLKKPKIIYCIGLIRRMVDGGEGVAVTAGLKAIATSELSEELDCYTSTVLSVWLTSIAENQRFLKLDLTRAFEAIDFEHLLDVSKKKSRQIGVPARTIARREVIASLKEALV